jgi:hypothetical protein
MFVAKLKLAAGAVVVLAALGATGVAYRAAGQAPAAPGQAEIPRVAEREAISPVSAESSADPPRAGTSGLPPVRLVNSRQVKLDFSVSKLGRSGLGGVDVYVTADDGTTWARAPGEPTVSLPAATEAGTSEPLTGSVAVTLEREGVVYGFALVVKNKAGVGRPAPKPGEPPQVRLELDATRPAAELFAPRPAPGQPNTLLLAWMATDRNLADNPVSLEWAEARHGPWHAIGAEPLPNSGRHAWALPEGMPVRVYLRLSVRDRAGNVAVALTSEPTLLDSEPPVSQITGVEGGSKARAAEPAWGQAEAALKALREAKDEQAKRRAADDLDKAVKKLRQQLKE